MPIITIKIDLSKPKQDLIKLIILKRAYKGYCKWVEMSDETKEAETPLAFNEFKKFDFWKIEMSFRIYFNRFKNLPFSKSYLNFNGLFLNKA